MANSEQLEKPSGPSWRAALALHGRGLEVIGLTLLCLYGIFLRTFQYASNYSLHLDECLLAMNLLQRDLHGLGQVLSHKQVGPLGFLYGEKLLMIAAGNGALVMRFLPFVVSVLAIIFFYLLAKRLFSGLPLLAAVALFSANQALVFYAATLKQYSLEALVAIILLLSAFPLLQETPSRRDYSVAAAAALLMWFSFSAIFVLAGIGLVLVLYELRHQARHGRQLCAVFAAWIVIFLPFYWLSIRTSASIPQMVSDWTADYVPLHPVALVHWMGPHFAAFLATATTWRVWPLAAIFFLAGIYYALRSRDWKALAFLSAIVVCLVAGMFKRYPFSSRLQLFLVPSAILLIVAGYKELLRAGKLRFVAHGFAGALVLWCCVSAAKTVLVEHSHLDSPREVMQYLVDRWQPGDHVCVSEVAEQSFLFYDRDQKIQPAEYTLSYSGTTLPRGRVWFFYFRTPWTTSPEYQLAFRSLQEQGIEVAHFDAELHSVALFVIRDAARPSSMRAINSKQHPAPHHQKLSGVGAL